MVRVRILAGIAGEGRSPGEVLDLPASEAKQLVAQQRAELVRGAQIETPERSRSGERSVRPERSNTKKRG